MKMHAFVRSNIPETLKLRNSPRFSSYLYFLFAPTLVYRHNYPRYVRKFICQVYYPLACRTPAVRWKYVTQCFLEVLLIIYFTSFIFERHVLPVFRSYGKGGHTKKDVTMAFLESGMAGGLLLLCLFYCVLHAWMNAFSEMLRFGDRMFYKVS